MLTTDKGSISKEAKRSSDAPNPEFISNPANLSSSGVGEALGMTNSSKDSGVDAGTSAIGVITGLCVGVIFALGFCGG